MLLHIQNHNTMLGSPHIHSLHKGPLIINLLGAYEHCEAVHRASNNYLPIVSRSHNGPGTDCFHIRMELLSAFTKKNFMRHLRN